MRYVLPLATRCDSAASVQEPMLSTRKPMVVDDSPRITFVGRKLISPSANAGRVTTRSLAGAVSTAVRAKRNKSLVFMIDNMCFYIYPTVWL